MERPMNAQVSSRFSSLESSRDRSVLAWLRLIQLEWSMSIEQLSRLLHTESDFLSELLSKKDEEMQSTLPEGLETAAPLIGIYRRLAAEYPKSEDQVKWLFSDHQEFGDSKPIDVAISSVENLYWVAYYLDSLSAAKGSL